MPKYHVNECIVMKNCATSKWSHYITKSFWNMECFFKFHTPPISLVVLTPPIQPFIYRLCPFYKAIKTCLQQQHIINSELESLYYVLFIWNASTTNQSFQRIKLIFWIINTFVMCLEERYRHRCCGSALSEGVPG